MRVDSFAPSAASDVTSVAAKESSTQAVGNGKAAGEVPQDRTTLMSGSDSVSSLTVQAMQSGASRAARVQSLQQSVSSGDYKLEPSKIADAMVSGGF